MNALRFNYETIPQADSIVALCARPSMTSCATKVKDYMKQNKSIVLTANYDYRRMGIFSNYTYITDPLKLIEQISNIRNDLIIPIEPKTDRKFKKLLQAKMRLFKGNYKLFIQKKLYPGLKLYEIGMPSKNSVYKITDKHPLIKIRDNGEFPYARLGSAGQGCIILSLVFKPKKLLIVGLDGPDVNNIKIKHMYDGTAVNYGDQDKFESAFHYINDVLIPSVITRNIQIETFRDVKMYGINKEKLGIKILD